MKSARIISPSDIRLYYFGSKDVLGSRTEKESRQKKLQQAVHLTHNQRHPVNLYLKLPTGETIETSSDWFDFTGDFVITKEGYTIPIWAIVDVTT